MSKESLSWQARLSIIGGVSLVLVIIVFVLNSPVLQNRMVEAVGYSGGGGWTAAGTLGGQPYSETWTATVGGYDVSGTLGTDAFNYTFTGSYPGIAGCNGGSCSSLVLNAGEGSDQLRFSGPRSQAFRKFGGGNLELVDTFNGRKIMQIYRNSDQITFLGSVYAASHQNTSDVRLKRNVETLEGVLSNVLKLRGVSYEWDESKFDDGKDRSGAQVGLIAQEVEQVYPELVGVGEDGYKSLDYSKLAAVLIEAVKELKAENDDLKRRVELLEVRE